MYTLLGTRPKSVLALRPEWWAMFFRDRASRCATGATWTDKVGSNGDAAAAEVNTLQCRYFHRFLSTKTSHLIVARQIERA